MSYSIVLLHNTTALATFPISTFFLPSSVNVYDASEILVAVDRSFTVKGSFKPTSEASASALWIALRTIIEGTGSNQVDGVRLIQAPSSVIEDLSAASNYALFKIESFSADPSSRSELQWHSEVNFSLKITGRHRLAGTITLEQHDSWAYDDVGLLTRTLSGAIETQPGTSALAQARTLGLALPGAQFAYITDGPEGVNVEQLDAKDTKATFTSSYQQSGGTLPSGVSADFSVKVESVTTSGETLTTTTVTASGPGADAAVAARAPSGALFSRSISSDPFKRRATAVYVQKGTTQPGRMLMLWSFSISGGGAGAGATQRSSGRVPALHVLPLNEVRIVETVVVKVTGIPSDSDFKMPDSLSIDGVLLDGGPKNLDPGTRRTVGGLSRAQDEWSAGVTRNYVAAEIPASLPTLIGAQVLRPDSAAAKATTPGKILSSTKSKAGSSGSNDLSGLGGLGIAGAGGSSGDAKITFGAL